MSELSVISASKSTSGLFVQVCGSNDMEHFVYYVILTDLCSNSSTPYGHDTYSESLRKWLENK